MISVNLKGFDRLERKLTNIISGLPTAAETGVKNALEQTAELAIKLAPAVVGKCIKIETIDRATHEVVGRVYTDTTITNFAPYVEFGTGVKVDDQGNKEAIRLKRAKTIPWYIHVSMVPASFARYGYPIVTGANGQQYYEVDGMYPNPYMHPAAFGMRESNVQSLANAVSNLIKGA